MLRSRYQWLYSCSNQYFCTHAVQCALARAHFQVCTWLQHFSVILCLQAHSMLCTHNILSAKQLPRKSFASRHLACHHLQVSMLSTCFTASNACAAGLQQLSRRLLSLWASLSTCPVPPKWQWPYTQLWVCHLLKAGVTGASCIGMLVVNNAMLQGNHASVCSLTQDSLDLADSTGSHAAHRALPSSTITDVLLSLAACTPLPCIGI